MIKSFTLLSIAFWSPLWGNEPSFDHSHLALSQVLKQVVVYKGTASEVNYLKLKTLKPELEDYLNSLSAVSKPQFAKFPTTEQKAFLINAYNGFTLKLVGDNYPIKSIKKLGGLFSSPWKKEFFQLLGSPCHLDRIEHEWLRPKFKDARIHFAVNCASIGCPRLRNEAYRAAVLDKQLEEQAKDFFKDASRNRVLFENDTIEVSKIFDWFKEDFKPSVKEFVAPYFTTNPNEIKRLKTFRLKFTSYDWAVNDLKP